MNFDGESPSDYGFGSERDVTQWEDARQYDINSFFGSDRGTRGSIGFDLVYYDNESQFYSVQERTAYEATLLEPQSVKVSELVTDGRRAAGLSVENPREVLVTHPGESFGARANNASVDTRFSGTGEYAYAAMKSNQYGVWIEEISHFKLGMNDLYAGGIQLRGGVEVGLMSSGAQLGYADFSLPEPYSVISRTRYNNIDRLTNEDRNRPWAQIREVTPDTTGANQWTVRAERVTDIELGESVEVVDTGQNGVKYAFQVSPTNREVTGFRVVERDGEMVALNEVKPDGTVETGDRDLVSGFLAPTLAEFTVREETVSGEAQVDVTLELVPPDSNHELIGMTPTSLPGLSADVGERPNVTVPDADLRAVDSEGRVTGVTEDGEFVNEIPGAEASGDRVQGPEWISVPSDADVEFEVSTADVQQYVNETGASEENATISYTTEVTEVGENPQLTTVNGTLTVTNTTTTRTNTTAGPGETKTVTQSQLPAVCDTCSAPADPDGDGLYEDVDGNGLVGFGDVIVLYENLGSRAVTDHVARYDYDGNGLVGFGDVIDLYETL